MRESDGPELLEALAARGLRGELVDGREQISVEVADCDESELAHAIEDWIRQRQLPFVPVRIDDCTFAVSPPAG
ncbi:MAG TPA: hypothetical protein VFA24_03005 [Gaiellaceae bacterium]|nr:hypothetical protein [Gaiellaceae bacterium]